MNGCFIVKGDLVDIESYLRKQSGVFIFFLGLALNCLTGYADYVTGQRIGIGVFYLLPIFLVTWFLNKTAGVLMSVICAATMIVSNLPAFYVDTAIEFWNTFMHFCFFMIFVLLLSKIKHAIDERDRFIAKLERSYKDMESFTYIASHDLRSPLIAISGFSRILQEDYAGILDEKGRDLLSRISSSAKRMSQLIDDILSFSRVSAREVKYSEIDMKKLVCEVFEEMRPAMGEHSIRLEIKDLPQGYGDMPMIRQVFVNFLSNAIKFTRTQTAPAIEVGGFENGKENVYYVRDNGIGFDEKFRDKLFGLFQRLHTSHQFEGTGIGLFMIKRVVEKHGGRVWAEGALKRGATFYFCLPRRESKSK